MFSFMIAVAVAVSSALVSLASLATALLRERRAARRNAVHVVIGHEHFDVEGVDPADTDKLLAKLREQMMGSRARARNKPEAASVV